MNRQFLSGIAGAAGFGALLVALFFSCFERASGFRDAGASEQARRNPLLAASRLLESMGHPVVSLEGPAALRELPPASAALLLTTPRRTLSKERSAALRAWVESGGHLIVETWSLWGDPDRIADPLLDPLELRAHRSEPDGTGEEEHNAQDGESEETAPSPVERGGDGSELAVAWFPERSSLMQIEFDRQVHFSDPDTGVVLRVVGEAGPHLVTLALGRGLLTALTDSRFLLNARIASRDHAELLLRLVRLQERRSAVWIVTSERWPGIWSQLRRYATPILISAAVWLGFWLWRAAQRCGPVSPAAPAGRRSWMEHLEAAGRHHWSRDRGRTLLAANRASLLRRLERSHPHWARLSSAQRNRRLSDALGIPLEEVATALEAGDVRDAPHFVQSLRNLERIRRAL